MRPRRSGGSGEAAIFNTHEGSEQRMRGKPNYRFGRTERDRAKKAKREDKLKSRQERAALREPEVSPTPREDDEPSPE
jgi:hypothetical protein